jgi:transposase-like protein
MPYCHNNSIDYPFCTCGNRMAKAGFAWSGKNKVQRWRCNQCGATTSKKEASK